MSEGRKEGRVSEGREEGGVSERREEGGERTYEYESMIFHLPGIDECGSLSQPLLAEGYHFHYFFLFRVPFTTFNPKTP